MQTAEKLKKKLFQITPSEFESFALEVFEYQAQSNPVYKKYIQGLGLDLSNISKIIEIPFLPIQFYKSYTVLNEGIKPQLFFESSGTTGMQTSKQGLADPSFYKKVSQAIFESFYGKLEDYYILALLPSYLERNNSSLVYMVQHFIENAQEGSGFYLNNFEELKAKLKLLQKENQKVLLLGVTFALLDLAENIDFSLSNIIVIETGGMKGRRKEMIREEVHQALGNSFQLKEIHSEYGMTELTSQAYSLGKGIFQSPTWMKVLIREANDPFSIKIEGSGGVNIIDLANIDTCAFIETQDLGKVEGNAFQIIGRFDNSDLRGCNLLVS